MKRFSFVTCTAMLLAAAAGIAFGAGNSNTTHNTAFQGPTFHPSNTDCTWAWINNHPPSSTNTQSDPPDTCFGGTQDAYSYSIAWGMQIETYSWAKDECTGSISASSAAASVGNVTLVNTYCPPYCTPWITGDWMPQFRGHAENNSPSSVSIYGKMKGDTNVLNCHVLVEGSISLTDGSGSTTVQIGPAGIPVTTGIGSGSADIWPIDNSHDAKALAQETAVYSCTTNSNASADAYAFDWYGEAWGVIWYSKAGLDLHGNCASVCTGYAYIIYNWY